MGTKIIPYIRFFFEIHLFEPENDQCRFFNMSSCTKETENTVEGTVKIKNDEIYSVPDILISRLSNVERYFQFTKNYASAKF